MKHSKGLILLCVMATLGPTGCSDDDDPVVPGAPQRTGRPPFAFERSHHPRLAGTHRQSQSDSIQLPASWVSETRSFEFRTYGSPLELVARLSIPARRG